jgi:hypothetical protein
MSEELEDYCDEVMRLLFAAGFDMNAIHNILTCLENPARNLARSKKYSHLKVFYEFASHVKWQYEKYDENLCGPCIVPDCSECPFGNV